MNRLRTVFPVLVFLALLAGALNITCPAQQAECKEAGFRTLVFGDSILWGEGLQDEDKFVNIVGAWLKARVGAPCLPVMYAHAGATIETPGRNNSIIDPSLDAMPKDGESLLGESYHTSGVGEVNISYPTIPVQVRRATESPESVDLVLMDGCINDVNFRYLVNAANTENDVKALVNAYCQESMTKLLGDTASKFTKANIIVTGYFPLIYAGEERSRHNAKGEHETYEVNGSANNLITRKAITVLRAGRKTIPDNCDRDKAGANAQRKCIAHLSDVWFKESNAALAKAVQNANTAAGGRIYFAPLSFPSWFAFSTKQSMLWNLGFGSTDAAGFRKVMAILFVQGLRAAARPNDKVRTQRVAQCKVVFDQIKTRFDQLDKTEQKEYKKSVDGFMLGCKNGSLGHPNKFGSALYAQAVIDRLSSLYPER